MLTAATVLASYAKRCKWKLLILWHLKDQAKRFSELKRLMPKITEKMLIQQLRELERDGIVNRIVHSKVPPNVEYLFTDYGKSLEPTLKVLCEWGQNHLTRSTSEGSWRRFSDRSPS